MSEVKSVSESTTSSSASELDQGVNSSGSQSNNTITEKGTEIETLTDLCGELEKKVTLFLFKNWKHSRATVSWVNHPSLDLQLKDLHQLALNPKSILSELLGIASAKLLSSEKGASPTVLSSLRMELTHSSASELDQCVNSSGELEKKVSLSLCKNQKHSRATVSWVNHPSLDLQLKDLHKLALNPKSILSELLGMASAKSLGSEKSASPTVMSSSRMATADSSGDFDSPTVSTAHTNGSSGVTHLGVVGRGVKRVLTNSGTAESSPMKKPALDSSENKADGKNSWSFWILLVSV